MRKVLIRERNVPSVNLAEIEIQIRSSEFLIRSRCQENLSACRRHVRGDRRTPCFLKDGTGRQSSNHQSLSYLLHLILNDQPLEFEEVERREMIITLQR